MAVAAVLATTAEGFAPTLRTPAIPSFSKGPQVCVQAPRLRSVIAPKMGYFEDLAKQEQDKAAMDGKGNVIMPDSAYTGFVDATDGFDGGDGQVGVVGDGSNAMESFDNREVINAGDAYGGPAAGIGGREEGTAGKYGASGGNRVDKRWNAWGSDSTDETFKDRLKEEGVTDVDIFSGEDKKEVQRQQLENWANQQKQWQQERGIRDQMATMGAEVRQKNTDDYKDFLSTGRSNDAMTSKDMENVIFATGAQGYDNSEILKKNDWKPCKAGFRIDGEFEIVGDGLVSIMVEPNSMVSEQYIARFTDDTPGEFLVAKTGGDVGDRQLDGMLPRRGTTVEFVVRFHPQGPIPVPKVATLVIDAEDNWKWTYKISGRS
eukprot:Tamp_03483.p2 GENE.Tamp_03483~~Tamp_03483.p2  ORF type:complete len:387 (+),score=97.97 Tamp_03483:39-1163(+)